MTGGPTGGEPTAATVESLVRRIQARTGTTGVAAVAGARGPAGTTGTPGATAARRASERPRSARNGTERGRAGRSPTRGPLLGLLEQSEWERLVHDEALRQRRYGHVHAIVLAEIRALDQDDPPPSPAEVERAMPACGSAILGISRASDRIGRLGPDRFGILLREADATGAGRFASRALAACDPWLAASPVPMRLALGWAAPDDERGLDGAHRLAERHLTTGHRP